MVVMPVSPAAEICLVETSPPYLGLLVNPSSELDRVLNPRGWILQMGKLSHCQGGDVPAATHPSSGASTSLPGHWTPKAAIRPLTVCPEPSLNCLGSKPKKRALTDTVPHPAQAPHLWIQAQQHRSVPQSCCPSLAALASRRLCPAPRWAQGSGTKGCCVVSNR